MNRTWTALVRLESKVDKFGSCASDYDWNPSSGLGQGLSTFIVLNRSRHAELSISVPLQLASNDQMFDLKLHSYYATFLASNTV